MSGASENLLRRAVAGEEEALGDLVRLHEPSLLAFVRARAGPELRACESVRDILQDVLLELVQGLDRLEYRDEAQFRGWLYTLAERRVRDRARHFRRQKRDGARVRAIGEGETGSLLVEGYSSFVDPGRELVRREEIERLEAAFARLSEPDREVLSLAYICGMRSPAIARQLGIEPEAARKRKVRARTRLAALWGRLPPGPGRP